MPAEQKYAGSSERSSNRGRTVGHAKSKDGSRLKLSQQKRVQPCTAEIDACCNSGQDESCWLSLSFTGLAASEDVQVNLGEAWRGLDANKLVFLDEEAQRKPMHAFLQFT